jgi:hypothetical protein
LRDCALAEQSVLRWRIKFNQDFAVQRKLDRTGTQEQRYQQEGKAKDSVHKNAY